MIQKERVKINRGLSKYSWIFKKDRKTNTENFVKKYGISPVLASILKDKGINNHEDVRIFLEPTYEDIHDPFQLKSLKEGVDLIESYINSGKKILIWGDYDVDGITATALLYSSIRELGGNVNYHLPSRFEGGYGLNNEDILQMKEKNIDLIITVDCGISAVKEIEYAKSLGIDIIVTDHHRPPEILPQNCILINPQLEGCNYPYRNLSGVGVAYKVHQGLWKNKVQETGKYLPLVALGTIADMVPLDGENRILVKLGIDYMKKNKPVWLKGFTEITNLDLDNITAFEIGYVIGPRLNAAGRIGHPHLSLELLLEVSPTKAKEFCENLESVNKKRQQMVEEIYNNIIKNLDFSWDKRAIILYNKDWNPGVLGIVAARLVDTFYKPVILFSLQENKLQGSARSIPSIDLYNLLKKSSEYILKFGGHSMAAGLTVEKDKYYDFVTSIESSLKDLDPSYFTRNVEVSLTVSEEDLTMSLAKELSKIEPFGPGNSEPILGILETTPKKLINIGKNQEHLTFYIGNCRGVAFNTKNISSVAKDIQVSLIGNFRVNRWNGREEPQFYVKDIGSTLTGVLNHLDDWEREWKNLYNQRNNKQYLKDLPRVCIIDKNRFIANGIKDSTSFIVFYPPSMIELKLLLNDDKDVSLKYDFPYCFFEGKGYNTIYILDPPISNNWIKKIIYKFPHSNIIGAWDESDVSFMWQFYHGFFPERSRLEHLYRRLRFFYKNNVNTIDQWDFCRGFMVNTFLSLYPPGLIRGLKILNEIEVITFRQINDKIEFGINIGKRAKLEDSNTYNLINGFYTILRSELE